MDTIDQTAPVTFEAILEPLKPAFAALERFLGGQIPAFEPEVQPLVDYCFGHSGKKLRPILVFSMAMDGREAVPDEGIIKAAAIVELVHLATLVHDDILDEADLRHRTETVVSRYGSHVAVLLGDALFAHALNLAASYPDVAVCRTVAMATRQVCSGEIAQTFARGEQAPGMDAYYRMIDLKTAELFRASAFLGGYLAGFGKDTLGYAGTFARHLGIAYQIYDDAADIFGREGQAGKTLGTDLATGKYTLPVLIWLESLEKEGRTEAFESLNNGERSRGELQHFLQRDGVDGKVREAFHHQLEAARKSVEGIPGKTRKDGLLRLAAFVEAAWNKFSIR